MKFIFLILILVMFSFPVFSHAQYIGYPGFPPDNGFSYPIGDMHSTCTYEIPQNIGKIHIDKHYKHIVPGMLQIKVIDPDVNNCSGLIQEVTLDVWSTSNPQGIQVTLIETGTDTGIFEGSFETSFDESDRKKSILKVSENDLIIASYLDNTLPNSFPAKTWLAIKDTMPIGYFDLKLLRDSEAKFVLSPLKQWQSGIIPYYTQCTEDLVLTFQRHVNRPICVTPETSQKLYEREWSSYVPKIVFQESTNEIDSILSRIKNLEINSHGDVYHSDKFGYYEKLVHVKFVAEQQFPPDGSFLSLMMRDLTRELQEGDKPTFTLIEAGYANPCTSPKLEVYAITGFPGYYVYDENEPIYEETISYPCPEVEGSYTILNFWTEKDFSSFPECYHDGMHEIFASHAHRYDEPGFDRIVIDQYYCNSSNKIEQ